MYGRRGTRRPRGQFRPRRPRGQTRARRTVTRPAVSGNVRSTAVRRTTVATTMKGRLVKLERKFAGQMEYITCLNQISKGTLTNITVDALIRPNQIASSRTFNTGDDSILNIKCTIKKIAIQCLVRPVWASGATLSNTPYNEPVFIRFFFVHPKWAYRMSVPGASFTTVTAADFVRGVHYDFANAALPMFGPLLNREYFNVLGFHDYKYMPTVVSTGAQTLAADPGNSGVKTLYWKFTPNMVLDGKNRGWSNIEDDDVPFTKQLYCVALAHTTSTGLGSAPMAIPFKWDMAINYGISTLQNK